MNEQVSTAEDTTSKPLSKLAVASPPNWRMMARKNSSVVGAPWRYLILKVGPRGPSQTIPPSYKHRVFHADEFEKAQRRLAPGHAIFEIDDVLEGVSSDRTFKLTFEGWNPKWTAIAPTGDMYEVRHEDGYYRLYMNNELRWPTGHNSIDTVMGIAADCAQAGVQ